MIAIDTETTGVDLRHGARPFLVTMCDEDGPPIYWEWDVDPETRTPIVPDGDADEINQRIDEQEALVLHNAEFDVSMLRESGIRPCWPWHKTEDTLTAGHLLASAQFHDLTTMVLVYLKQNIKPYEDRLGEAVQQARRIARSKFPTWRLAKAGESYMPSIKGSSKTDSRGAHSESAWRADMWLLRAVAKQLKYAKEHPWWTLASDYANTDSASTRLLWDVVEQRIRDRQLWRIYEERRKVLRSINAMRQMGVTVIEPNTVELRAEFVRKSAEMEEKCNRIARGLQYDLKLPKAGRSKNLDAFVFDVLKLEKIRNPKGKTDNPMLDSKVAIPHYLATLDPGPAREFIETMAAKRKRDTAITYLDGYRRFWLPTEWEGIVRLFPSLNSTGSGTLRFSSSNPNSQNVGKQEIEGKGEKTIRYCFGPAPGREWVSLDYENIELRIPAYESGEKKMIELFERPDEPPYWGSYHLLNASILYPDIFWPIAEIEGEFKRLYAGSWYGSTKNFGFAVGYGAGERTADLAAKRPGAWKAVKDNLKEHDKLNRHFISMAHRLGYVETIPDKTVDPDRGYPIQCKRGSNGSISPTIPLNYHVQSTAMWCTMKAMIRCQEQIDRWNRAEPGANYFMTMQVHDEIVFDLPARGEANRVAKVEVLRRIMEKSGDDIGIPLTVSASFHPRNWGESLKMKRKAT